MANRRIPLTGHLLGLDGVRGLAILMVMAVHFVGDATPRNIVQRVVVKGASFGLLGVDLFFVLSGFLITGLLLEAKGQPGYFRNFYARRTLRIFPLSYGVLAVLFLVLPLFTRLPPLLEVARSHQVWLWTYTSNLYTAATNSWASITYLSHFWSLAIEEHFYLLWPLVVFLLGGRTLSRVCIGILLAGLLLRTGLALVGVSELSISVLTPCRIDTLATGALLAVLVREEGEADRLVRRAGRAAVLLFGALGVISAWCAITHLGLPVLHQIRNSGYALFFGALTLLSLAPATQPASRFFRAPLLRFFGKYSYGLYVYHGLLTWAFLESGVDGRLDALLENHALAIATRAVLGVGVSTAIAVLSYELYEKRFLALKRHFGSGRRTTSPPSESPLTLTGGPASLTTNREPPR